MKDINGEFQSLFHVGMYRCYETITEKQRKDLIEYIKTLKQPGLEHPAIEGETYHPVSNFLDLVEKNVPSCHRLKRDLEEHVNYCGNAYELPKLSITNSWYNIQSKNTKLQRHCHPESLISGALYLDVNELTNPLIFTNPNPYAFYFTPTHGYDVTLFQFWYEGVENSKLLLFPSWLHHETNVGKERQETMDRIVIGFNSFISREQ